MATGALAGLVDGFTRGYGLSRQWAREDEEAKARAEERAYTREQRERLRREQAADDEIDRRLSSVPATAEKWGTGYEGAAQSGAPVRDDDGNLMPGVTSTQRSYRDIAADQAAAIRGIGGRRGVAMASQLQQFVDAADDRKEAGIDRADARKLRGFQLSAAELSNRQALAKQSWQRAGMMFSRGDLGGALQTLSQGYETYPDGRKLVATKDGQFGLATPDGRWVEPPIPITKENVEAALNHAQRFLDPSAWAQFQGVRQGDAKIADEKAYREFMQRYYDGKLGLERDEFGAKQRGGMFQRPPTAADVFNPIGLSDDGKRILGRQGSRITEQPVPAGYSNLFPKVTGDKGPRAAKFLKGDDGTHTAYADDGRPLYNVINGGLEAPLGVDNTAWSRMQRDASKAGVRAALGKGPDGAPAVAFICRDGLPYSTLEEAAAAKPAKK